MDHTPLPPTLAAEPQRDSADGRLILALINNCQKPRQTPVVSVMVRCGGVCHLSDASINKQPGDTHDPQHWRTVTPSHPSERDLCLEITMPGDCSHPGL